MAPRGFGDVTMGQGWLGTCTMNDIIRWKGWSLLAESKDDSIASGSILRTLTSS